MVGIWVIPRTLDWGETVRVYRLLVPVPTDISDDSVTLLHKHSLRGSIFVHRTWWCSYRVAMIQESTHLPISKWRQSGWERGRKGRGRAIILSWIHWVSHRARKKQEGIMVLWCECKPSIFWDCSWHAAWCTKIYQIYQSDPTPLLPPNLQYLYQGYILHWVPQLQLLASWIVQKCQGGWVLPEISHVVEQNIHKICSICCDPCITGSGCTAIPHEKHHVTSTVWIKPRCLASLNTVHLSVVIAKKSYSHFFLLKPWWLTNAVCSKIPPWEEIVQLNTAQPSFVWNPFMLFSSAGWFLNACKYCSLMEASLIIIFSFLYFLQVHTSSERVVSNGR